MTDLDKATTDTAAYEGYKAAPYKDTRGLWTVGEGTCLETNPIGAKDWKYLLDNKFITVSLSGAGARALATDATSTTFLTTVVGGGTNAVPVVFDGVNWVIG